MMIRLYGYPDNVWTDAAVEALRIAGIVDFEMKPAPEGVNWDNPDPRFRMMPTLTLVRPNEEYVLARGIVEIKEMMANAEKEDAEFRTLLSSWGLKKEDVYALWDCPDLRDHQEGQPET